LRCGARPAYDPTGFEQSSKRPEKHEVVIEGGAKSGARKSDLQKLIEIWRGLSETDRAAFLSRVESARNGGPDSNER
jgi:hypothetical protein